MYLGTMVVRLNQRISRCSANIAIVQKWKVDDYMTERDKEIAKLFITEQSTYRELGERL